MLWTEKYAPKRLDEIVGNDKAIEEVRKWALLWEAGKPQKPLLLVGPPGVGKTATAYALAKEFNWEIIEMNASDERSAQRVLRILGGASEASPIFGKRKLILIDEVDGIQGREDRGGVSAILKILRSARNPVILTANDEYAPATVQIKGLCKVVKYKRVNYRTLAQFLAKILEREGIPYEMDALLELAKRENGDVRSAILDLQAIAESAGRVDKKSIQAVGYRDRVTNIFEVLRKIFKSEHVIRPFTLTATLDMDPDTFKAWVVENIPREYEDPEEIGDAFHWVSRADVFDGRIKRRQYWGFLAYSSELLVNGTIVAKKRVYRKFPPYSFPQWIKEQSRYKNRRAAIKRLADKLCPVLHVSRRIFVQDYLPILPIIFQNRKWAAHLTAAAKLDEKDLSLILNKSPASPEIEAILAEAERIRRQVIRRKIISSKPREKKEERVMQEEEQGKQVTLFDYIRPSK